MFRRIVIFIASLLLLLNSALVNASIGGWTLSNPTALGASILYDGTKGSATSSILISPNASQVAKVLRGGIAGIALRFAVEQLLGAVDWILDPANNQVQYKIRKISPGATYYLDHLSGPDYNVLALTYCAQLYPGSTPRYVGPTGWSTSATPVFTNNRTDIACYLNGQQKVATSIYLSGTVTTEEKYLSLITAAQQVIENAESDNLDAQFAVLAAATNILSEAEQDDAKAKPIEKELEDNADDKCRTHNAYMNGQARIIEDRYNELFVDSYDLYNKYYALKNPLQGVGSWEGHIYRYVQVEQPILRQRILDAALEGCYETPNASRWKQKSPPPRPGIHSPG